MHKLPEIEYSYDALAPIISADIMELHHKKHHQTYVDKLNIAIDKVPSLKHKTLVELLTGVDSLPTNVRDDIRNHGGGHYNHSLFWKIMTPGEKQYPEGILREAIDQKWGSVDDFVEEFSQKATLLFGSGWVWLTRDLELIALSNQNAPMALGKGEPLMGLDVWEHAYYLDYKNKRDEYIKNWWNIVNWRFIEKRYEECVIDTSKQ